MKFILGGVLLLAIMAPAHGAMAQELHIADNPPVTIENPERSKAYYGKLQGEPEAYHINSETPFTLFITLLTPQISGARTDFSAEVVDTRNPEVPLAILDGNAIEWQNFTERAGGDEYLAGPAFRATVPEGSYEIRLSNPGNEGSYVLIVGEERSFSLGEILNTYNVLPRVKSEFFNEPAFSAFTTPLLLWPLAIILLLIAVIMLVFWLWRSNRSPQA